MAYRKFRDGSGAGWEVRDESRSRWVFEPMPGNAGDRQAVSPPGYTDDPYEMSDQELQRLLDRARPSGSGPRMPSPFKEL